MNDPLKGKRSAINDRTMKTLIWPAMDEDGRTIPCPVAKGDRFELRSCTVEIETVSRALRAGVAEWQARFIRHESERVYLLRFAPPVRPPDESDSHLGLSDAEQAKREGMYTTSMRSASPHEPESVGPEWEDRGVAQRVTRLKDARREIEEERMASDARAELGRVLKGLDPDRRIELLAYIQRGCDAAKRGDLSEAA